MIMRATSLLPSVLLVVVALFVAAPLSATEQGEVRGGVGMQVVPIATGDLVVLKVLPDSPADKAGVLPGDVVRTVNGHTLRGSNFEDVAKKWLWGEAGKIVEITLQRPGATGSLRLKLRRVPIRAEESVAEVKMIEPGKTARKRDP